MDGVVVRRPRRLEYVPLGDLWAEFMTEQNSRFVDRIRVTADNRAKFLHFVNEKAAEGNVLVAVLEEGGEADLPEGDKAGKAREVGGAGLEDGLDGGGGVGLKGEGPPGVLVGYVTFDAVTFAMELEYEEAAILDLYIKPEHRGKGWGRRLIRGALDEMRAAGYRHVRLQVYANNEPAIGFYQHVGFRRYIDIMKVKLD